MTSPRTAAGQDNSPLTFSTSIGTARARLIGSLAEHAKLLLRTGFLFDRFGSGRSGFHMVLSGIGQDGKTRTERVFLVARSGHGPYIPCMPAILLARKLAEGTLDKRGAMPCLDLIDLAEYLAALDGLDIELTRQVDDA